MLKKVLFLVPFFLAGACFYEYQFIGFPDGYKSDYSTIRGIILLLSALFHVSSGVLWLIFCNRFASLRFGLKIILVYIVFSLVLFWLDSEINHYSGLGG